GLRLQPYLPLRRSLRRYTGIPGCAWSSHRQRRCSARRCSAPCRPLTRDDPTVVQGGNLSTTSTCARQRGDREDWAPERPVKWSTQTTPAHLSRRPDCEIP